MREKLRQEWEGKQKSIKDEEVIFFFILFFIPLKKKLLINSCLHISTFVFIKSLKMLYTQSNENEQLSNAIATATANHLCMLLQKQFILIKSIITCT